MKKILGPVLLSLAIFSSSCAKRSAPGDDVPTVSQENSRTEEINHDDFQLDENKTAEINEEEVVQEVVEADKALTPALEVAPVKEELEQSALASSPVVHQEGELREYTVNQDDTLMLVAFKIYGDYSKWKALKKLNKKTIGNKSGPLAPGLVLKYHAPAQDFVQQANGEPYIIMKKDTLGKISKKVYSTAKRWESIWKNNPYIINPNIIFAGFTVFYVKDDKVASK